MNSKCQDQTIRKDATASRQFTSSLECRGLKKSFKLKCNECGQCHLVCQLRDGQTGIQDDNAQDSNEGQGQGQDEPFQIIFAAARGTNELGVCRLGVPERRGTSTESYFKLCKSRTTQQQQQSRLDSGPAPTLRHGDEASIALVSPPTVQQAVNSDISVNKHLGRHPFRGPKCDKSLEAWAQNGKVNVSCDVSPATFPVPRRRQPHNIINDVLLPTRVATLHDASTSRFCGSPEDPHTHACLHSHFPLPCSLSSSSLHLRLSTAFVRSQRVPLNPNEMHEAHRKLAPNVP
ncbi:hypothetical protein ACLKA6_019993 [Drosophila palustris]